MGCTGAEISPSWAPRSAQPRQSQPFPNLQEPWGQPVHPEGAPLPRHGGAPRLLHRELEGHPEPLAAALQPHGAYRLLPLPSAPFPGFFFSFWLSWVHLVFFFCWQVSGRCDLFSYFLPRKFPGWEDRKGKRKGKGKGKGKRKRKKEEEKENEKIKRKRRKGKEKGKIEILSI